jgi:hypothetical protein
VTHLRLVAAACAVVAVAAAPVAAHDGIPRSWWLSEASATRKLQEREGGAWVSGNCRGIAPGATRACATVYKHFACTGRRRGPGGITFSVAYRVHVVGPRGRIVVGG